MKFACAELDGAICCCEECAELQDSAAAVLGLGMLPDLTSTALALRWASV